MISNFVLKLQTYANRLSDWLADILEDRRVEKQVIRFLDLMVETGIRGFALIFIVSVFLTIGPSLESKFGGVFTDWSATNFKQSENQWSFDVQATKPWYRRHCVYVDNQIIDAKAITSTEAGAPIVTGLLTFGRTGTLIEHPNNSSRYYGHWVFTSQEPIPAGSIIYGNIKHNCHFLWISTTVFGPFRIEVSDVPVPEYR